MGFHEMAFVGSIQRCHWCGRRRVTGKKAGPSVCCDGGVAFWARAHSKPGVSYGPLVISSPGRKFPNAQSEWILSVTVSAHPCVSAPALQGGEDTEDEEEEEEEQGEEEEREEETPDEEAAAPPRHSGSLGKQKLVPLCFVFGIHVMLWNGNTPCFCVTSMAPLTGTNTFDGNRWESSKHQGGVHPLVDVLVWSKLPARVDSAVHRSRNLSSLTLPPASAYLYTNPTGPSVWVDACPGG